MAEPEAILLLLSVAVPAVGALIALVRPLRRIIGLSAALTTLYVAVRIFLAARTAPLTYELFTMNGIGVGFYADVLSSFIVSACSLFAGLLALYSPRVVDDAPGGRFYPALILVTLAAANGAALAGNLLLLAFFWGCLAALLYTIMLVSRKDPSVAAQKALIIVGVSDVILLFGLVLLIARVGVAGIVLDRPLPLSQPLAIFTYLCICVGALAKAGAMPLHSWIPEAAKVAPAPTMAFIPASLDKLLGIYLLVRASYFLFDIRSCLEVRMLLLTVGSVTIVAAVMMAMVQKESQKLLSFCAVSQVGYMVMGIGTGLPIGIAGGLFHMINHAIYKACLFLSAGSVEYRTKTSELEKLGGLGSKMPITLFTFLVAALAISGVPPLNGFYSKWMVYQGVIGLAKQTRVWPVFLISAMFGSILTLALMLKMIHAQFLGSRPKELDYVREAPGSMTTPSLVLAALCIVFGIFAVQLPLRHLIFPALPFSVAGLGFWSPTLATVLLLVGIGLGLLVFASGTGLRPRKSTVFTGGELLETEEARIPGTEFYSSIGFLKHLPHLLKQGEEGVYDVYNQSINAAQNMAGLVFKYLDRFINQINYVVVEAVSLVSSTVRSFFGWVLLPVAVLLLGYVASGDRSFLRLLAIVLMLGGPILALTETDLYRFFYAAAAGQLGFVLLSFSIAHHIGPAVGLYQLVTALIGLEIVYIGVRRAVAIAGGPRIDGMQGILHNAGLPSVGFILGGFMLSALPPSANFIAKYVSSGLFAGQPVVTTMIVVAALLNLASFLRITRLVFLGPDRFHVRPRPGFDAFIVIIFVILNLVALVAARSFIGVLAGAGG